MAKSIEDQIAKQKNRLAELKKQKKQQEEGRLIRLGKLVDNHIRSQWNGFDLEAFKAEAANTTGFVK